LYLLLIQLKHTVSPNHSQWPGKLFLVVIDTHYCGGIKSSHMKNLIYSYALIMSFYDQGEDYIDSFLPFVLGAIEDSANIKDIQSNLKQNYGIEMPSHVATNVLNKAKRKDYVAYDKERFQLTSQGTHYLEQLETETEVERRLNALINDIAIFFRENNIPIKKDTIANLLYRFILENLQTLLECINPGTKVELKIKASDKKINMLIRYIKNAEKQKPEEFHTIQDIVFGSIISVILHTQQSSDLDRLMNRFKNCQAFLDCNYIFSVLGLHADEFNEPAKELFNLLKQTGFTIKAFDFTLAEMSRVLASYPEEEYRYPRTVNIDSVHSCLKRRGWTKTQVAELIANLEEVLTKAGISIEWETGIDLNTFEPEGNGKIRSLFTKYKFQYSTLTQNHDLAAIEKIKHYRGHPVRQIQRCKALFLTSDNGLSRFNFIEMGHKDNRTVSEVIIDRLLTNILWLRNPGSKLPIKSILAAHSRSLFVQRRVWERFYDILKNLRQQEKVQDENISTLFYHGYIENVLSQFEDSEADKITEEFALETIEKAAKLREEETTKLMKNQEQQFMKQLDEAVSKGDIQKEREWLIKIQDSKTSIRTHAEQSVRKRLIGIKLAILAGFCVPFVVCLVSGDWNRVWNIISIVALGLGFLQFFIPKLWDGMREKWMNSLYTRRLEEAKLDRFGQEEVSSL
jgi:hypothetical protein